MKSRNHVDSSRSRLAAAVLLALSLPALAAEAGRIVSLTGSGEYRELANAPWRAASLNQPIAPLSFVHTGDGASMSLLLADKAQIKLGQNTVFQVREANAAVAGGNTVLGLQKGRAWGQIKQPAGQLQMVTPSAAAGIHGTDWVIEVAESGETTVTVLSGVVSLDNAQGSVSIAAGEEGRATVGSAPVKRRLVNARERVQWVADYRIDTSLYPELAGQALLSAPPDNHTLDALAQRRRDTPSAYAWLLAAELQLMRGDDAGAQNLLDEGRQRYGEDWRFALLTARLALFRDQPAQARTQAEQLMARHGDNLHAALLLGDVARQEGDAATARSAYRRAIAIAPGEPRGWLGLGITDLERGADRRAANELAQARQLSDQPAYAAGEFGTQAILRDQPAAAQAEFAKALAANGADYVALTGQGIASLKQGNNEAALQQLLATNAIEPKYARAVSYLAIAYYRQGKLKAARDTLQRASELDPNDPLPYVLRSMIARDDYQSGEALDAARAAAERMPRLKSLNQLASDRQGGAHIGGQLADMGLSAWAAHYAHESALADWGSSHLFLAEQYAGDFNRSAEIMQGLLLDPTVFGSDPKRPGLLTQPGQYGELTGTVLDGRDLRLGRLAASSNGYSNASLPLAWYVAGERDRFSPKDDGPLSARASNLLLGVGAKPLPDLALFGFASRFAIDSDLKAASPAPAQTDSRDDQRINLGGSYRLDPGETIWLKAGWAKRDDSDLRYSAARQLNQEQHRQDDLQYRQSLRLEQADLAWGAEWARLRHDTQTHAQDKTRFDETVADRDHSRQLWLGGQFRPGKDWLFDGLLAWQHYRKQKDDKATVAAGSLPAFTVRDRHDETDTGRLNPRLGFAWRANSQLTLRAAWQRWQRPAGNDTLAPVDVAGVALADQYVLPGGELRQWRVELGWEINPRLFASLYHQQLDSRNILFEPLGNVENRPSGSSQIDSLLAERLFQPSRLDTLPDTPAFAAGRIRQSGLQLNALLDGHTALYGGLLHSHSENRREAFTGLPLPAIPERQALAGLAWASGNWTANIESVYRAGYPTRESAGAGDTAPATHTARLLAGWRSSDRQLKLQLIAQQQRSDGGNERLLGLKASWRF
ncbi:tetratricopeptide repeat protein [Chitinimonas sp.]|uniref:tetratricopeptide repeat protein n=1 Tax=Chitinimonas sp. TaxID=1934313 RepID=UPI0035B07057